MASRSGNSKSGARSKSGSGGSRSKSGSGSRSGSNGHVSAPELVRRAVRQVAQLTGRSIEGVLGLERRNEGWVVTLEVVELRRVPDSTDVLASYAVAVDGQGELQEYRRTGRYYRSQVEGD